MIYKGFKRDFLMTYTQLESTPLEKVESIDMLRILEHGYKIQSYEAPFFNEISLNDQKDYEYLLEK